MLVGVGNWTSLIEFEAWLRGKRAGKMRIRLTRWNELIGKRGRREW